MISNPNQLEGATQHQLIIAEATRRGIDIEDISSEYGTSATHLSNGNTSAVIVQGIVQEWLNKEAEILCDEKHLTKTLFDSLNIPNPKSCVFSRPKDVRGKIQENQEYVCKPVLGTNGIGVQLGIRSMRDVDAYYSKYGGLYPTHLLEEFVEGYDLRIQVIDSKIVAVCLRLPAFVEGDGSSTLTELIDMRRREIRSQNPANDLIVDHISRKLIELQGFSLNQLVPSEQKIRLKEITNMAQGGHAIDVTDEIDIIYHEWVASIANELKTGYFALDVITTDHKKFVPGNSLALELNIRAEWMHHTFSEKRTHDLARLIIDTLFNE